jgi:hypothetical protein
MIRGPGPIAWLGLPVLLAAVGALLHLSATRQSLQRSVDAAAQKGAEALAYGRDPTPEAFRSLRRSGVDAEPRDVAVISPIPDGRFAGQPRSVRVRLAAGWKPPLLPELPLEVRAGSAVVPRELVASDAPVMLRIE